MNKVLSSMQGIAVVVVLAISSAGCGDLNGGSPRRLSCDTQTTAPRAQWAGQVFITSSAHSICDVPPTIHQVYLYLEEEMGDVWADRGNRLCVDIPPNDYWIKCELARYECHPGLWRTRILVTGSGPDGKAFSFEPETAETLIESCPSGDE